MKQFFFLCLLLYAIEATAQDDQNVYLAQNNRPIHGFSSGHGRPTFKGYINNVDSRVARHLLKNFADAKGIQWVIDDEGSTAYFSSGEKQTKVRYDKDGRHISTRKVYSANKLDPYIGFLAKKNLEKDFIISGVTEVQTDDGKIYQIILQNKFFWSVVEVAEDRQGYLEIVGEDNTFLKV